LEACQESRELVAEALAAAHAVYNEACQAVVPCGSASSADCAAPPSLRVDVVALRALCQQAPSEGQMDTDAAQAPASDELFLVAELLELTDPHEVLGLDQGASKDEVRRAYYRLARAFHPDKHGGSSDLVIQAFNDAFMLITRSYMSLVGSAAENVTLQILNKIDLRKGRPQGGWAAQHKYEQRQREPLAQAEAAVRRAEEDLRKAEVARPGHSQERRLTMAKLALQKARARVLAETELLALKRRKDEERAEAKRKREEGRAAREQRERQRPAPKRARPAAQAAARGDPEEEAARLEAQAEEMKRKAAELRARAEAAADAEAAAPSPESAGANVSEAAVRPSRRRSLRIVEGGSVGSRCLQTESCG